MMTWLGKYKLRYVNILNMYKPIQLIVVHLLSATCMENTVLGLQLKNEVGKDPVFKEISI